MTIAYDPRPDWAREDRAAASAECSTPRCVGTADHYGECWANYRPLVSLVKARPYAVLAPGTPVEYVTNSGAWARARVRQTSATGNVWLRSADDVPSLMWVAAIPSEVRPYR